MSDWIDIHALWRIVVYGLAFGAVLPMVFGLGLRLMDGEPNGDGTDAMTRNPAALAAAAVCFAAVVGAIAWGVYLIVKGT